MPLCDEWLEYLPANFGLLPESLLGSVVLSDYCDSPLAPAEWPHLYTGVTHGWRRLAEA
jgi:hypothetical protein